MDIFGKYEDFDIDQDYDNEVYQTSEYSLFDDKTKFIYVTDEFGRFAPLIMTQAGRMMNDLIMTEQIDVFEDLVELMINFETNGVDN
jgi:hypothetical protein